MSKKLKSVEWDEVLKSLKDREDGIREWLHEEHRECFKEQNHLDGGSVERTYWHYGYAVALGDVLRLLNRLSPQQGDVQH